MEVFAILADPTRRSILDLLRSGDLSVGEIVDGTGAAQPRISKHLKVLRDGGLVSARALGPVRRYQLQPDRLSEADEWLASFRGSWSDRLDALGRVLDRRRGVSQVEGAFDDGS